MCWPVLILEFFHNVALFAPNWVCVYIRLQAEFREEFHFEPERSSAVEAGLLVAR
jgi:hypothetical protein